MDLLSKYGYDFLLDCSCFVSFVGLAPSFDEKIVLLKTILELNEEFVHSVHDNSVREFINKHGIRCLNKLFEQFIVNCPRFPEEISLVKQLGVIVADFESYLKYTK